MSDASRRSRAFSNAIQTRKRFKIQNPSERMHPTKLKLQRTADKVLRLLSVHISFAVDVR